MGEWSLINKFHRLVFIHSHSVLMNWVHSVKYSLQAVNGEVSTHWNWFRSKLLNFNMQIRLVFFGYEVKQHDLNTKIYILLSLNTDIKYRPIFPHACISSECQLTHSTWKVTKVILIMANILFNSIVLSRSSPNGMQLNNHAHSMFHRTSYDRIDI